MSENSFQLNIDTSELLDFSDNLEEITKSFPKEMKRFLSQTARDFNKKIKKDAKSKTQQKTGNYLEGFKTSKAYVKDGRGYVKIYNKARHAHLIESGHKQVPRGKKGQSNSGGTATGTIKGKYILKANSIKFIAEYTEKVEKFVEVFVKTGLV